MALVACASAPEAPAVAGPARNQVIVREREVSTPARWSGNLQRVQQQSGRAFPTSQNKAYGTVHLAAAGPDRARVRLFVSTSHRFSTTVLWAVHSGRCGTGSLPLMAIEHFPAIEIGGNGRGEVDTDMALRLPATGTYHVNIYWTGRGGLSDVMTCANLKRESES